MKRGLVALLAGLGLLVGSVGAVGAQPPQAAATVTQECEDGVGQLTVIVKGRTVSEQTVPNERSQGRGPCQPSPGQVR